MEACIPGRRNLDGTGRRARVFGGLVFAAAALLLLQLLSAPETPRVYRFTLFFPLFPAVLLLLEALAGFSAIRGMALSGGGLAEPPRNRPVSPTKTRGFGAVLGPGRKDPVVLDRRRANLLLALAFFAAVALGAALSL
ncbi:MAG: hypothetical protein QXO51_00385 [Halobacteria archaeon]